MDSSISKIKCSSGPIPATYIAQVRSQPLRGGEKRGA